MVELAARASWSLPAVRLFVSGRPVVLLYHETPRANIRNSIDSTVFANQIGFLRKHFDLVAPRDLMRERPRSARPRVLLTFDDGFRSNAELAAPILRRYQVPALFFVSTRHAAPGGYLWFAYLRALRYGFEANDFTYHGQRMDMRPHRRAATVARLQEHLLGLRPHPAALYQEIEHELPALEDFMTPSQISDNCAGMSEEQIGELSADPMFEIGAHTVDHPFLTHCEPQEIYRQVADNRSWLERVCGRPCAAVAYPSGDYDAGVIDQIKGMGFETGYAVIPNGCGEPMLEVPRMGVYRASRNVLGCKATWGNTLRSLRVPVG